MTAMKYGLALTALLATSAAQGSILYTFSTATATLDYRSPELLQFDNSGELQLPANAFVSNSRRYETAVLMNFTYNNLNQRVAGTEVRLVSYAGASVVDDGWLFPAGSFDTLGSHTTLGASFGFTIAPGTLTVTSVPEPELWALLTSGFGIIGCALRRRPTMSEDMRRA